MKSIVLFQKNLRLQQNPSLFEALSNSTKIIPVFIIPNNLKEAQKYWLHFSLQSLNNSLKNKLNIFEGNIVNVLKTITKEHNIEKIFTSKGYCPQTIANQRNIQQHFPEKGLFFNDTLLHNTEEVKPQSGNFYKVFTPFFKKGCLSREVPPLLPKVEVNENDFLKIHNNTPNLLPQIEWWKGFTTEIGEDWAIQKMQAFFKNGLRGYKELRNYPSKPNVSRLSPHLAFGEISPITLWHEAGKHNVETKDLEQFRFELGWREFSYHLLWNFPNLETQNFNPKFNAFPWEENPDDFTKWKKGQTGFPIVDAGMRELWQTGWMHNRVRMIVASFLVKHLLINWQLGEKWFANCLLDYDHANNTASWQWVAGCGADAAPYFRIFNPILQGQRFDENGDYIKKFVPELKNVPAKFIHEPWLLSPIEKLEYGVENYPEPMIEHIFARDRALAIYENLKITGNEAL